ncbi:MAG: cell envelope integrity protein TolA [Deltaproteobacteria bacterium]|nr:cell envelope integrity protein TolA [Deltaproteobacteria bacterium]
MNQRFPSRISNTGAPPPSDRITAMPLAVSVMLHLLVMAAVIWMPNLTPERGRPLSVIDVTMVSLKDAAPGAPGPPALSAPLAPPKPAPKAPEPKPQKAEPAPRAAPKVKKSLKHQTYRPSSAVAQAISELEQKVDFGRPAVVDAAIERLKSEAGPREAIDRLRARVAAGTGTKGGGGGGGGSLGPEDMYRLEVAYAVNKNWVFSESLAGGRGELVAEVAFTVLPNGRIKDLWFDRKSGNSYLDESARRAIMKAEPFPPHPKGVRRPYITVGLRFTPKGVTP